MDTIINVHYLYHYTVILGYNNNDTEDTILVNTQGYINHKWEY